MATILQIEDFVGVYRISVSSHKSSTLQAYIEQTQEDVLSELDLTAFDITKDKYIDLLSVGKFKDVLLGLTYFNYVRDNFEPSTVGAVNLNASNSTAAPREAVYEVAKDRFNRAAHIWNKYTLDFLREFSSLNTEVVTVFDNTTYWVLVLDDAKYLENGDKVTIGGVSYVVDNIDKITNSIEVAKTNVIVTGESVFYSPFNELFLDQNIQKIAL